MEQGPPGAKKEIQTKMQNFINCEIKVPKQGISFIMSQFM